jgi:hypothetical protein
MGNLCIFESQKRPLSIFSIFQTKIIDLTMIYKIGNQIKNINSGGYPKLNALRNYYDSVVKSE